MTELKTPVIVVNFKVYPQVEGEGALRLAKACEAAARASGVSFAVCPPMVELSAVARSVSIPVLSQHTDARSPGAITGYVSPQSVKASGAAGTLLNHAEHRMEMDDMEEVIIACKQLGLATIVCTKDTCASVQAARLSPDMIAVEPPELIGGDVSVTSADPEIVSRTVNAVHNVDSRIKVLCGAGVKNGNDVRKALELGAEGVLLASGVVKAKDVETVLRDLISGI